MSEQIFTFEADNVDVDKSTIFKTLISAFEGGGEQRRRKQVNPRRSFQLRMEQVFKDDMKDMEEFFEQMFGAFDNFLWEHNADSPTHKNEVIATGLSGATDLFALDNKNIISNTQILKIDGVLQVEGVDYTLNDLTGDIVFISGFPSGTTLLTEPYRFRHRVRFQADSFDVQDIFRQKVYSIDVGFITEVGC